MGFYFDDSKSLFAASGADIRRALGAIVDRYIAQNPPCPFTYRPYHRGGLQRSKDYRYHADFAALFPEARQRQYVYAWAKLHAEARTEYRFDVNCRSPLVVYLNRRQIFRSDIFCERYSERRVPVALALEPGWNHCVVRFQKTRAGFGGSFGTWLGKHPYYFVMPTEEREDQEGWLYSEPVERAVERVPGEGDTEAATGLSWLPKAGWGQHSPNAGSFVDLGRLFGPGAARCAVAWTQLVLGDDATVADVTPPKEGAIAVGRYVGVGRDNGGATVRLRVRHAGDVAVWLDGEDVGRGSGNGVFEKVIQLTGGSHDLWLRCEGGGAAWGFEAEAGVVDEAPLQVRPSEGAAAAASRSPSSVAASGNGAVAACTAAVSASAVPGIALEFRAPAGLKGAPSPWFFLGPLPAEASPDFEAWRDLDRVKSSAGQGSDEGLYWRLDGPELWVRPYNDNPLYAKWNYPLGVTLYGLLHSGRVLGMPEVESYVVGHMQRCCDTYDYAMWDRERYGGATNVHHLLTSLDSLDDCGSFGSALLETARHHALTGYRRLADLVADYIAHKQARLPDGTFFRRQLMHTFHENTLWADDLYMSVPFLCRYHLLTGEASYLDDAARQFLGFRQRLYMPELRAMSHVYDFNKGMATGIPWGRGNGWTVFSLAELLTVLPESHALRAELLGFYRDLCAGYLALQGPMGMWHQVLNEHDAYPETSCTSMFIYAFARGLRRGWLPEPERYAAAIERAWEALTRQSIDAAGNVHGVCRGSEFSFTSDYYKRDLLWNLNDTHGTGIVLLAGVESLRWREKADAGA